MQKTFIQRLIYFKTLLKKFSKSIKIFIDEHNMKIAFKDLYHADVTPYTF
jgi:hypothetical protein